MDSNLFWLIIIGIVAGFLAGKLMKGKGFGIFINLLVGIAGAILGGWLFGQLGLSFGDGLIGSLFGTSKNRRTHARSPCQKNQKSSHI